MPADEPARTVPVYSAELPQAVSLRALPAPDAMAVDLPPGHVCLVVRAGGGHGRDADLTVALARRLQGREWPVVVLVPTADLARTEGAISGDLAVIEASDLSEAGVQRAVDRITQAHGQVAVVVYACTRHRSAHEPDRDGPRAILDAEDVGLLDPREQALLRLPFLLAKTLQPSLEAAADEGYASFVTITQLDGMLGLSGGTAASSVVGGLAGLTKTLRLEWPSVYCRAIDLSPELAPERGAELVMAELEDPNRLIAEVGWSDRGRVTLDATQLLGISAGSAARSAPVRSTGAPVDRTNALAGATDGSKEGLGD